MAIASMLSSMADWWTPTVLFCVLNLMIATIFIVSNFKSANHHHHNTPSQLARSFESDDQYKVHYETTECNSASQLSRRPSLLQRVKSIDFSFSSFHNLFPAESEELGNSPTERTRTLSLLDRVKSFKLTSSFNSDHTSSSKDEHSDIDPHHDSVEDNDVTSVSEKSSVTPENKSPNKLTKLDSEKKVATSKEDEEDDDQKRLATKKTAVRVHNESVDAKADDFIKRFKQQLKLQRVDSLQRLREMLSRGTSYA